MNRLFKWATILVVFYLAVPVALALFHEGLAFTRAHAALSLAAVAVPTLLAIALLYRWCWRRRKPPAGPRVPPAKRGNAAPPTVTQGAMQRHAVGSALPDELAEFLGEERNR